MTAKECKDPILILDTDGRYWWIEGRKLDTHIQDKYVVVIPKKVMVAVRKKEFDLVPYDPLKPKLFGDDEVDEEDSEEF